MIHLYNYREKNIAIDPNSGSIHLLDNLSYDILSLGRNFKQNLKTLYYKYSKEDINSAVKEIEVLIEKNQLFSKDIIKTTHLNFSSKKNIKAMCLHVSHDCNLRCEYCFASQGDFQGSREVMDFETGKKAFDYLIKKSNGRKNLEVDFFGGEPLMNFDIVKKLVYYGRSLEKKHDKNFRYTLTTNCLLLDDKINSFLNKHMDNVVLSIDGRKSTNDLMRKTINNKGSYDLILPKIKRFIEQRGSKAYYVRGTFTRNTMDFSKDILHLAKEGFYSLSMEPVVAEKKYSYAFTKKDIDVINGEYEKLVDIMLDEKEVDFNFFHFNLDLKNSPCAIKKASGCGAGSEYISITPFGDIYPCHQFVGNEKFKLGNLNDGITNKALIDEFSNLSVYNKKECEKCFAKYYCSGGCHANAWNENNDLKKPYSIGCELEKRRVELAIYYSIKKMEVQ